MRCAVVDIGSNTTRLLVADVVGALPREILARKLHTHLGRALRANEAGERPGSARPESPTHAGVDSGLAGDALAARVAAGVAGQVAAARATGAQRLRIVATAAVRDAAGGPALCAAVRAATGVPVDVLPSAEEARLAFLGATRTAPPQPRIGPKGAPGAPERHIRAFRSVTEYARVTDEARVTDDARVAVVDVGGGSTELAVGTPAGGVQWSTSVPLGSGWLADRHLRGDPPGPAELAAVQADVARALAGVAPPAAARALGVGGSAASLARIAGDRLDAARVGVAVATLTDAPAAVVAARTGLLEERVRLLPAGLLLLAAVADLLGRPLELGCGGLREGVCLELAGAGDR